MSLPYKKWSGPRLTERRSRATELRRQRSRSSLLARRVGELVFAREVIDDDLLAREPMLVKPLWLAYGYMSAFERTELFCRHYIDVFTELHGRYKDYIEAQSKHPLDIEYARNDLGEMSSLWKARQQADALGMPYPLFLRTAMEYAVQHAKYKQVPRPNQLLSEKQIEAALAAWAHERPAVQLFAHDWDPRFVLAQHRSDPPRLAAVSAAIQFIKGAPSDRRALRLASFLGEGNALSIEEARRNFDGEVVEEAVRRSSPQSTVHTVTDKYYPPCLGLRTMSLPAVCDACPVATLCARTQEVVNAHLKSRFGTVDPKAAKKRAQARQRKRRQRERERAKLTAGASG